MELFHILEFAQEKNADELYAQIRDLDSCDETLSQIADSYENADIDDEQFCDQVEEHLAQIGYNCKRFIELTREDLVEFKSNLPIDDVSIYDFKSSAMSRDEMRKAELITFKDGEQIKELKNRYRFW